MKNSARGLVGNRVRQVVVITVASAGVGRATARAFAESGADIGLIARGRAGLEGAGRELKGVPGNLAATAQIVRRIR